MKFIITAGGTSEKIDEVRKITNSATGRLGSLIAKELVDQSGEKIEKIYYICEKGAVTPDLPSVEIILVQGVNGLKDTLTAILSEQKIDAVIHSMAVSDYTVNHVTTAEYLMEAISSFLMLDTHNGKSTISEEGKAALQYIEQNCNMVDSSMKISSDIDNLILMMKRTPKIIGLIKASQPSTLLVGFKLLDNVLIDTLIDAGYRVLTQNDCDFVLANDSADMRDGGHIGYLISQDKSYERLDGKQAIATRIASALLSKLEGK